MEATHFLKFERIQFKASAYLALLSIFITFCHGYISDVIHSFIAFQNNNNNSLDISFKELLTFWISIKIQLKAYKYQWSH